MRTTAVLLAAVAAGALASTALAAPRLSRAERRALNRTVDAFVLHAVRHRNASAAWSLVSPTFRAGMTRAQFAKDSPAYPFDARGRHFPWTLDYVEPNEIGGSLLLQPRNQRRDGPILFDLRFVRNHGAWVIDSLIPKVIFGPPHAPKVRSVLDYSPQPGASGPTYDKSKINGSYIVIPIALFGAFLAGLVCWGVVRWYRDRREMALTMAAHVPRARPPHRT